MRKDGKYMNKRFEKAGEELKPRNITLSLSDNDIKEFFRFAYRNGTTPEEVLQGFICDLVHGSQTRGSDERMYAEQYFSRCLYGFQMPETFLMWVLDEDGMDEVSGYITEIDCASGDLAYYEKHPEHADPEAIADAKEHKADMEQELFTCYAEYADRQKKMNEPAQDLKTGIEEIKAYLQNVCEASTEETQ